MTTVAVQFDSATARSLDAVRSQLIATAKGAHAEIVMRSPKPLNYVRHVDGREAPEEAVKPNGIIVYDYNRLDLIAKNALDLLRKNSPVKSGDYVRSHTLFLNLKPVENLKGWKPGDEISITNTIIYARVIEVGKRGGKTIKFSMPPNVYEKVARALKREYKEAADIQFTYRAVLGESQVNQMTAGATPLRRGAKGRFVTRGGVRAYNKAEMRWPTITINPGGSFMTRAGLR